MPADPPFIIASEPFSLDTLEALAVAPRKLVLAAEVIDKIDRGAAFLRRALAQGRPIYGVNTGFGSLEGRVIAEEDYLQLQKNLLLSHAATIGPLVDERTCRLTLLLKLLTFRTGRSGIPRSFVERLIDMWNQGSVPTFPSHGTVGASGDLGPLAHFSLPLLGMGVVYDRGTCRRAEEVCAERGWTPLPLEPKAGLALANGIQYVTACGVRASMAMRRLIGYAELAAALAVQGFACASSFYDPQWSETTLHGPRRNTLENLGRLLQGSNHFELPASRASQQDPYSFRCLPQVHGAVRQAVEFAAQLVEQECNTVSDNPIFIAESERILYGGNMHGASIGLALDTAAIGIADLSSMSQCRIFQLLSGGRGLPDYLAARPGLHSGYMMAQVTAAALYAENVGSCTPSTPLTVMTCQMQEDHVSMAGGAARKLDRVIENTLSIVAIELLVASQAVEMQAGLRLSPPTRAIWEEVRAVVPSMQADRPLTPDIEAVRRLLLERGPAWLERTAAN